MVFTMLLSSWAVAPVACLAPQGTPLAPNLAPEPVRVMPLGDSITQGGQQYASYRYPLWFALQNPALPVDFVGVNETVHGGDGGGNPNTMWYPQYYTAFDRDHESYWGFRTDQFFPFLVTSAESEQPDVVLMHLGTNDIGQSGASGLLNAQTNLPLLIDNVRSMRPVARFLLAQIIPIGPGSSYFQNADQVVPLNAAIADIAGQKDEPFSPVFLVDQYSGFDLSRHMQPDGLHPNLAGEVQMAGVWLAALGPALQWPDPPSHPAIDLANPSFESLGLPDGAVEDTPAGIEWSFGATDGTFKGVFNPTEESYFDAAGGGTPRGADGDEAAYLYDNGSGNERVTLFQTLDTTLEPSTTYTLSVAVGNRFATNPYGPSVYGGYRIELMAGNAVIGADADSLVPLPGTFEDAVLCVSSDDVPPELLQRVLTVRMTLTSSDPLSSTDFDNVRLTAR